MTFRRFILPALFTLACASPAAAQGTGPNLPWADFSGRTDHQVVIAAGTPDNYNGHPTTVLMEDGRTMVCTWSEGHGGKAASIARASTG